ncbi:22893_t:CDS:2 [Cetraspora pellucida]|uniref:22893_t:CDS:1 n=1 Tax=Cetraspora pellucida TaxID=1433469 RepID=A0A9N9G9T3_9GLOM|nr:22893_t:CDS:2 [Cetraspora pellucida]
MSELKFCTEILESYIDILADIDGSYTSWDSVSIASKHNLKNLQESANRTRPDFTVQNCSNYDIFTLERKKGRSLSENFQIFGATIEGFDIVIKRMISIDRYVIMQEIFIIEVPSSITDYYKLKSLLSKVIALSVLINQSLKVLRDNINRDVI